MANATTTQILEKVKSWTMGKINSISEKLANKVTSISNASTDTQYPSAKCVYDKWKANADAIGAIEGMIPSQASSSNKLADKDFVNSSVATNTATFRGTYNLVTALGLTISATEEQIATALASKMSELSIVPDNNDYAFVQIPTADATPTEIARVDRYKFNGSSWALEFSLNNSGFTAAQWATLNSGLVSGDKAKLDALPTNAELTTLLNGKESVSNKVTSISGESTDTQYPSAKAAWTAITAWLSGAMSWTTAQMKQARANLGFGDGDIDSVPTAGSDNVVKSGGVHASILQNGPAFDLSAHNAVGGTLATYADLNAALTALNALPAAYKYGGMTFKFVLSSDNNYIQFRLKADEFSTDVEDWEQAASIEKLESGDIIPKLAQNLESWEEDGGQDVSNTWDETIRTTAGNDPIDTTQGGVLKKIVAKTDFVCSGLLATAYNQLRLKSNGGGAVAVGTGWYFPVPKLTLGDFGSAQENNGLLLTDNNGNNIQNATVYFKALTEGVPTSVTDGTQLTPTSVSYNGKTYKVYTTSGAGYLIVSGITYANTCAHIAGEDWYDKFVSPTDPADVGDNISLTALFAAVPNGSGKFLVCGGVATYAERISNTQMKITDPIGRVTSPSWTNTLQEDGETYLHSLTVSGMKSGGYALIEGSDQILIVEGTTVKYSDTNATAISGAVRYEKSTAATAIVTLTKTAYVLNDCGIEMKEGAEGSAFFTNTYTQNIPDALSQIAKVKLDSSLGVIAEALLYLYNENKALREILTGRDNAIMAYIKAINIECEQMTMFGAPLVLRCSIAGAPDAANIPVNWDEKTMNVWNGTPRFRGQQYIDTTNSKVYYAVKLSGSTSDWVALN